MKNLLKIGKNKKQFEKQNVIVPTLLLSHTYFLNEQHTSYLSIGFDSESFEPAIILFKNSIFHALSTETWTTSIYNNWLIIQNHINGENNISFAELPNTNSDCEVKLTCRNNERLVLFKNGCKKLALNPEEWSRVADLLPFLHSIINWSEVIWQHVREYYNLYVMKCCERQAYSLNVVDFFIPPITSHNFFNCARLFNEIPVLCKKKLLNDYYSTVCKLNLN